MDMRALNLRSGGACLPARRPPPAMWAPLVAREIWSSATGARKWVWKGATRSLVAVAASGRRSKSNHGDDEKNKVSSSGNGDASSPTGDSSVGMNPLHKSNDPMDMSNSAYWRDVRARLVFQEQQQLVDADGFSKTASNEPAHQLGQKWAHPITMPESGCVLVATEELDGNSIFERTVILLLRLGSRDPYDGPFGVILNCPLSTKIKHFNRLFGDQSKSSGDCSLFFGGPLDTSMFLVRTSGRIPLKGFEEVMPGVSFGFRTDLEKAGGLMESRVIRPQDLNFYLGHSAWDHDQLLHEIEVGYWVVASCSSQLIANASTADPSCLWTEILQLMGGQYLELSRKPKQDSS